MFVRHRQSTSEREVRKWIEMRPRESGGSTPRTMILTGTEGGREGGRVITHDYSGTPL